MRGRCHFLGRSPRHRTTQQRKLTYATLKSYVVNRHRYCLAFGGTMNHDLYRRIPWL